MDRSTFRENCCNPIYRVTSQSMAGNLSISLDTLREEYSHMKFAPIEGKTQFTKSEMIASARRRGFKTATEAQFDHWVNYGLIGKGQQRGRKPALWSLPQMHLYLQLLEQNQRPGVHPIHLCTVTTWGWLYLGDETDIRIEQVERAMQTWQAMQLQHSSDGTEKRVARTVVECIASKKQEGKRQLINDIASLMKKLDYPTSVALP